MGLVDDFTAGAGPESVTAWDAIVAADPVDGEVEILIPGYDPDLRFGPAPYVAPAGEPVRGDRCVVVFGRDADDHPEPWVLIEGVGGGGGAAVVDASATVKGVSKLSVAPVSPTDPIAAGTNDPRMSDARTPTAHSHAQSDVTGLAAALAAKQDASTAATDAELAAHEADTTGVHGIADTAALVLTGDARLSDTRTPTDNSVTAAKVHTSLKGGPAAAVEALRALGTTATTAAAGNDSRIIGAEQAANKGVASGYAPLDSGVLVPVANLPAATGAAKGVVQLAGDLGGTAAVPTVPNLIPKTLFDAKGDLIAASANDTASRLSVGADGTVLVADSAATCGVKWGAVGGSYGYSTLVGDGVATTITVTHNLNTVAVGVDVFAVSSGEVIGVRTLIASVNTVQLIFDTAPASNAYRVVVLPVVGGTVSPPWVAALPGGPVDGQEIYFDAGGGVAWHLKYRSAEAGSFKWYRVGGPPLFAEVLAEETHTSTTYVDLATVGPSLTAPLAGDYMIEQGAAMYAAATNAYAYMSYAIGGTGAVDADAMEIRGTATGNVPQIPGARRRRKAALAASTAIVAKYRNTSTGFGAKNRWLSLLPVRVG